MRKKLPSIFQPNMRLYFILLIAFAAATAFFGQYRLVLVLIECALIIAFAIFYQAAANRRAAKLLRYIATVTADRDSASRESLISAPLPVAIFSVNTGNILWSNGRFHDITGERERFFEVQLTDVVQGFDISWMLEGGTECPGVITIHDRSYKVYGSALRSEREHGDLDYIATTYWVDITDYANIAAEYSATRPVTAIIMLDNYEELIKNMSDKEKSAILSDIDDKISDWVGDSESFLCKYDRDRYFLLFEEREFPRFAGGKFSVLSDIRSCVSIHGVHATVSIGIGRDGSTPKENFRFASLALDMALSRGGDQAVVKNRLSFDFYGGHSAEIERRTRVKARVMAGAFDDLIKDASTVFIMGHTAGDFDVVGASIGLSCIARSHGKPAKIIINEKKTAAGEMIDLARQLPEYQDAFISAEDAMLMSDSQSLLIVVDTSRPEQVESEAFLQSMNRVAVIDHHRRAATYIENAALMYHEPYASSASELVTEMVQFLVEQSAILRPEAEALLAGIVLDTKSFTIRTGSRTFDAAAFLRRVGADTVDIKRLMQSDLSTAVARYSIVRRARIYRDGIALAVSDQEQSRLAIAQASDELLNIAGVQASFVLSPEKGNIIISARSLGEINVQGILEKLGGGGNQSTAGAQIKGKDIESATQSLTDAIDAYLND